MFFLGQAWDVCPESRLRFVRSKGGAGVELFPPFC